MSEHISSGIGAPKIAPTQHNAHYLDVSTGATYLAKGTLSVSDWVKYPAGGMRDFKPGMVLKDGHDGMRINHVADDDAEIVLSAQADGEWWENARVRIGQRGSGRLKVKPAAGVKIVHDRDGMPATRGANTFFELTRLARNLWEASGALAPWQAPEQLPRAGITAVRTYDAPHLAVYNSSLALIDTSAAALSILENPMAIRVSPDGSHVVLRGENNTVVLRASDWTAVTLGEPIGGGSTATFSHDGRFVAMDAWDGEVIRFYRTDTWERVAVTGAPTSDSIDDIVASPLGPVFVAIGGSKLYRFDMEAPSDAPQIMTVHQALYGAFSPDGRTLAIATGNYSKYLSLIDAVSWKEMNVTPAVSQASVGFNGSPTISPIQFSPDGKYLAISGMSAPFLTVYDTSDWSSMGTSMATSTRYMAWAPDSSALVACCYIAPRFKLYKTDDWANPVGVSPADTGQDTVMFTADSSKVLIQANAAPWVIALNASDLQTAGQQPAALPSSVQEFVTSEFWF